MSEFFINNEHVTITQLLLHHVPRSGVRVYRTSPETVGLQIRVRGNGEKTARYAHANLSFADVKHLAEHLAKIVKENESDGV